MGGISYIKGDATYPQADGIKIICHICNDIGVWGRGFVLALSNRWTTPELAYRKWHGSNGEDKFELGSVQFVQVEEDIWIANMVAQHDIRRSNANRPIRYDAVTVCLDKVTKKAIEMQATVHMPRIGCGLAGGNWREIEPLIRQCLVESGIQVFVYDLE